MALAIHARLARRVAELELDGQRQRHAQLAFDVTQAWERLAGIGAEHAHAADALRDAQRKPVPPSPRSNVRTLKSLPPSLVAFRDAMANDPQAQNRHLTAVRARNFETYRALAEQLKLSKEQYDQLVGNLVKRYEQQLDLGHAMEKQPPGSLEEATMAKLRQRIEDELGAAQVALLGEEGYRQFELYRRTLPLRQFVDRLAGKAALGGAPITGPQADALIAAMADASPRLRAGGTLGLPGTEDLEWDKVFTAAGAIMGEAQITVLKTAAIPIWNKARLEELAWKEN